jgi:hypothetical protein
MTQGASTTTRADGPVWRTLTLLWLGWAILMVGYQAIAPVRLPVARPDHATNFSADETGLYSLRGRPYLTRDGLLGNHVAWDSQYYLSIALHGYGDPRMPAVAPGSASEAPRSGAQNEHPGWTSLTYAYFPAYPMVMGAVAEPLKLAGLEPVSAATLAGVLISLLGALAAVLAIADLTGEKTAEEQVRAGVYLLIWPGAAFLAQVYTEGLFVGLSFGAIALLRRRRWVWAALLAILATWTRANGVLLIIPFGWAWLASGGLRRLGASDTRRRAMLELLVAAAPAAAYLAWRLFLGGHFAEVEDNYFGRGMLQIGQSFQSLLDAIDLALNGDPQAAVYYGVEAFSLAAALICSLILWRRDKALALYGLAILAVAMTSGAELGFPRYVLAVPALFLVPARWGLNAVFDRLWSLANILGLGVWTLAFATGFWDG